MPALPMPDLGQLFCGTMNKVPQQRSYALTRAIALPFSTIVCLGMHDWCHFPASRLS
jgi:hypothetical protein